MTDDAFEAGPRPLYKHLFITQLIPLPVKLEGGLVDHPPRRSSDLVAEDSVPEMFSVTHPAETAIHQTFDRKAAEELAAKNPETQPAKKIPVPPPFRHGKRSTDLKTAPPPIPVAEKEPTIQKSAPIEMTDESLRNRTTRFQSESTVWNDLFDLTFQRLDESRFLEAALKIVLEASGRTTAILFSPPINPAQVQIRAACGQWTHTHLSELTHVALQTIQRSVQENTSYISWDYEQKEHGIEIHDLVSIPISIRSNPYGVLLLLNQNAIPQDVHHDMNHLDHLVEQLGTVIEIRERMLVAIAEEKASPTPQKRA